MLQIADRLLQVKNRIDQACTLASRASSSVILLAVSKTHDAQAVQQAYNAVQRHFGENYIQEAIEKITHLKSYRQQITWHLIGPLQSNKTKLAAENFDWIQSIDRLKIAQRLSDQRPENLPPLNVCIQVNISEEDSKSGISADAVGELCTEVAQLPRINLRGLMTIPEPGSASSSLITMNQLFKKIQGQLHQYNLAPQFDTLSMGMSDDLEQAIAAGSTMVRIGTAIFGTRPIKQSI